MHVHVVHIHVHVHVYVLHVHACATDSDIYNECFNYLIHEVMPFRQLCNGSQYKYIQYMSIKCHRTVIVITLVSIAITVSLVWCSVDQ